MKDKERNKEMDEERTPAVARNKDRCFQVRVYDACCAGLHDIKFRRH
jgi:hypothetical protein